tara:strand:+ start:617 stop:1552 length:936 start_codon:yes stop_codon:yes gene_type:complete
VEFRAPSVATELNNKAVKYLTESLADPESGQRALEGVMLELGNATDGHPDWHPILTKPESGSTQHIAYLSQVEAYDGIDHTVEFVRGFITCPYSEDDAEKLVEKVNEVFGLNAYRLDTPLYSDSAYPVVVEANDMVLEADGTIRSRDALTWFAQKTVEEASNAQVAETWWNIRPYILGRPYGSRSSLFVNQHTGAHMRKVLEALNNSGMFGPIKESSLDMLSQKKRDKISETLIRTAVTNWDKRSEKFEFELRGETCQAEVRDTWKDGEELSIRVKIGKYDLYASGFYYEKDDRITHVDPTGKQALAEKFI